MASRRTELWCASLLGHAIKWVLSLGHLWIEEQRKIKWLDLCQASVFPNTVLWALTTRLTSYNLLLCLCLVNVRKWLQISPPKNGNSSTCICLRPVVTYFFFDSFEQIKCVFLKGLTTTVVTPVMCLFRFLFELFPNSLWKLMNQWKKKNRARITIVSGRRSILNPLACLNSVCLNLAPWEEVGFALRPHLFSTEPRRRRPTGSKPLLQVPSPGLYQSRLELVSPHN